MIYLSLILTDDFRSLASPSFPQHLLCSLAKSLLLTWAGEVGVRWSLTRFVFPLHGAEAVRADGPTSRYSLFRTLSPQYWRLVGRLLNVFRYCLSLFLRFQHRRRLPLSSEESFTWVILAGWTSAHILGFHDPEG